MAFTEAQSVGTFVGLVSIIGFCVLLELIFVPIGIWFYSEGKKYYRALSFFGKHPEVSIYQLHLNPSTGKPDHMIDEEHAANIIPEKTKANGALSGDNIITTEQAARYYDTSVEPEFKYDELSESQGKLQMANMTQHNSYSSNLTRRPPTTNEYVNS